MPVHAAEMLQYVQNRQPGAQVLAHRLGSPQLQRRPVLAQQQQSGAVIDLPVDQDDRTDAGITQAMVRLQRGIGGDLLMNVGRGVAHHPLAAVDRDGNRGLAAPARAQSSGAQATAVAAVAVPLRKAPTGSRTQDSYQQGQQPVGCVETAPGLPGAEPDQRFAMYELISIPKRNTTAAGVTHFMCKFLVLISMMNTSRRQTVGLPPLARPAEPDTGASLALWGAAAHHGTLIPTS
jgi:hypothetical protein